MPTGENAEPTGGRVTRSLRKRLTSVDSDVPSRPGTPNNITLQTIPETNTPKKRVTRRASLSTPSAITPSKELTNTPGRRVTRRRSVNISESEDQAVQTISKGPTIEVVKEEEPEFETPKDKPKRVLRSSSKSPNDPENKNKNKHLSKKTTQQEDDKEEQDIIILDDSIDCQVLKPQSATKKTRVSIKKENLIDGIENQKSSSYSENESTPTKKSANSSATEKNSSNKHHTMEIASPNRNDSEKMKGKKRSSVCIVTPVKSSSNQDSLQAQTTPEKIKSDQGSGRKSKSAQKEQKEQTKQESPSKKKNLSNNAVSPGIGRQSLTNKNQSSPARAQTLQNSPFKKNHPEQLKNVAFNEEADENTVKSVYPKTPGLIKSKSYILDASNEVDKDDTFKSKNDQSFGKKSDKGNSDEEETAGLDTKSPYKLKLKAVGSSTPIQKNSPKQSKEKKEKSVKESRMTEEEGVVAFPKSWTKFVCGKTCDTSKIDRIVSEKSLQEKQAHETNNKSRSNASHNSSKNKSHKDPEFSDAEDDMLEEDDDDDDEEERDRNAEKTLFLDDEPLDVADAQESNSAETAYESNIPIQKRSPKQKKASKLQEQKEKSVKENVFSDEEEEEEKAVSFPKSWTKSVSGAISQTSKIDATVPEKSLQEKKAQKTHNKSRSNASPNTSKKEPPQNDSDDSDAEDDMLEEDDDEFDAEEERDQNAEKTLFLDDEPLDVADAQESNSAETAYESNISTQKRSPKQNKASKMQEQKDKSVKENVFSDDDEEEEKVVSFPKSWTKSVSGTISQTSKIDAIVPEKSLQEKKAQKTPNKSRSKASASSSKKKPQNDSDDSDAEDDMLEEDDSEFDAEEERDQNAEKTLFLDDEPRDVADAQESNSAETAYESNIPIQKRSPKQNKASEMQEQKEKSVKENVFSDNEEEEEKVVSFPKSWTKSVSGTISQTSKIDAIVPEKSLQEKKAQKAPNKSRSSASANSSKKKPQNDSDAEDDMLEEDDDDELDGEEDRHQKSKKSMFLDDEAMEVPDGEESMDSEERAYLEENEVPEYGESIGSQDSEEDDEGDDEELDEEDAAFVVSDTEIVEELLSSEDEVEKAEQKRLDSSKQKKLDTPNEKKYKRIYQASVSSEEESKGLDNKDDTDLCLFVDSSFEDENADEKQPADVKSPNKSLKIKGNDADIKNKSAKDKSLREASKLDSSQINKTVQETVSDKENGENEGEIPTKILNENNISKKDVAIKSEVKNNTDIENNQSTEKLLAEESRLNSSHLNQTVKDKDSDREMKEEEYISTTPSKPQISGSDDVLQTNEEEPTVLKSSEKKRLTKSPKRKSIITLDLASDGDVESNNEKSSNHSRKSVDASAIKENPNDSSRKSLNENDNSISKSKSPSKTPKKSRKSSRISEEDSDNQEPTALKSPEKKKVTKSPKRKSIITPQSESEDENKCSFSKDSRKSVNKSMIFDDGLGSTHEKSINQSRKSISKSIDASVNEETFDVGQRKSPDNSKDRKSLNTSRKSLIRTSTEETNDTEGQSTVQKTKLSLDERSEPEETLSASENPLDTSGGKQSLNTSKKLKKSFDHDSSLQNEQSNKSEKCKRRKLVAQQSIIESASESSADSEDEKEEKSPSDSLQNEQSNGPNKSSSRKLVAQESIMQSASESSADSGDDQNEEKSHRISLQNEQSNGPEKSNRRKSIARQSIVHKASESSVDSEEENEQKPSPEVTDSEMYSSHDGPGGAQFSDEENVATDRTISDFLGEEDKNESSFKKSSSRRKSIVINDSKLDETFQLDPKSSLSSSLHDTLHRSILRKSLNQSQGRKFDSKQAIKDDIDEEPNPSSESEEEDKSSEEEEVKIKKKIVSEKGLSVSLNSIQIKKKKLKDSKAIRNSFTIGVSVRKNSSGDEGSSENESVAEIERSVENFTSSDNKDSSSESESRLLNLSEEKVLEKVKDVQHIGPYKSRKSMSNPILLAPPSDGDISQKKKIKRTSLYLQEEAASNSFVENLAEEKKKIKQQKRKSNSFCGVVAPPTEDDDDVRPKEPRSEKKLKKSFESENKEDSVKHVLSRCEQMIEAANEAKRKAKLQAKKVKVKKPKWMDKEEEATQKVETEVEIPLVSKKEIKRKEKIKKELAKAFKQSAAVLSKVIEPVPNTKKHALSKLENKSIIPTKRLEAEFLESLMELSNTKKKKAKEIETTPPSDKENSKKKSNKSKYKIEEIHKKIESDIETLETACGTVIIEPSTPQKLRFQHGFRESPKTPIGFKIQDINSTDKEIEKKGFRKLKTPSGAFIEEDLNKKTNSTKQKTRKRKFPRIEEPTYTLPKTQWTPSGVFVEEDLSSARPLANSTATQFLVSSLNINKKNKFKSDVISSTSMDKALSFKKSALKSKMKTKSREILHVKQRKIANDKF